MVFPIRYRVMSGLALAVMLGGCAALRDVASKTYDLQTQLNPAPDARAVPTTFAAHLPHVAPLVVEPVCDRGTLNYIVPVDGGVVLIDAGYDENGAHIERALAGRKVLAVLLTHGHLDHRAAAHRFDAPVYVGAGDLDSFTASRFFHAPVPRAGEIFLGIPPAPRRLHGVEDGFVLPVGARSFVAVALPGHTPGSTAWRVGDVLFTGDAVQAPLHDEIYPAPPMVSEDIERAWRSLRRLADVPFQTLFDGHYGRIDRARAKVRRALDTFRREGKFVHPFFRPTGCAAGRAPHAHPTG